MNVTKQEFRNISLGYIWDKDMSYEEFFEVNRNVSFEDAYEMYELINERYIEFVYGETKD